jgi:hypothetical protein
MPATLYPNIVAFIEGSMERTFVNNNFHYVDVVPIDNGNSWSIDKLKDQIRTKYIAKDPNCDFLIIWLDREDRPESSEYIEEELRAAAIDAGCSPDKIIVCVTDRMTENLILADEIVIQAEFIIDEYEYSAEGCSGKSEIRKLYKNIDVNYKEMEHGLKLLKKIRLERAAEKSTFVQRFLQKFQPECWWKTPNLTATPSTPSPASPRPSS